MRPYCVHWVLHYLAAIWRHGVVAGVICLLGCSGSDTYVQYIATPPPPGTTNVAAVASYEACPKITSYTVSPAEHVAGLDVTLVADITSSRGVTPFYLWTATSGTFCNPNSSVTTYRCGAQQRPTLTLTVWYGSCTDNATFELDCTLEQ